MQMLLPQERFEHAVNLEPIEIKNSSNMDITSAVDPAEPHEDCPTLPEEIKEANRVDKVCMQIHAYLEAPNKRARPTTHLNSCRISTDNLLIKTD